MQFLSWQLCVYVTHEQASCQTDCLRHINNCAVTVRRLSRELQLQKAIHFKQSDFFILTSIDICYISQRDK